MRPKVYPEMVAFCDALPVFLNRHGVGLVEAGKGIDQRAGERTQPNGIATGRQPATIPVAIRAPQLLGVEPASAIPGVFARAALICRLN